MAEHDASYETEQSEPTPGVDRRVVLRWTWRGLVAGLFVNGAWTAYDVLVPRVEGGFGGAVAAGAEGGFPEGEVRYFPEGRFYLTRVDGELIALYQACPHLGCRVPYCESSGRFECPCHGSIFTRKGEYVEGPSPRGMDQFPLTVEDRAGVVDTGEVIEGPRIGLLTMSGEPAGPSCLGDADGHGAPVEPEPGHDEEPAGDHDDADGETDNG
jgi:cytochrome b6-f complex iron-sulfur subunit